MGLARTPRFTPRFIAPEGCGALSSPPKDAELANSGFFGPGRPEWPFFLSRSAHCLVQWVGRESVVRVERLRVRSKRAATARRMVCSVCKTVSGGRQETPREQRLLHSMRSKTVVVHQDR